VRKCEEMVKTPILIYWIVLDTFLVVLQVLKILGCLIYKKNSAKILVKFRNLEEFSK